MSGARVRCHTAAAWRHRTDRGGVIARPHDARGLRARITGTAALSLATKRPLL